MKNKKKILSLLACLSLLTSCNKSTPYSSSCKVTTSTPSVEPTPNPTVEELNKILFENYATTTVEKGVVMFYTFKENIPDELKNLETIIIPETIRGEKIEGIYRTYNGNFKEFKNLKNIKIPKNIKDIVCNFDLDYYSSPFINIPTLENIEVDSENEWYYVENNCLIEKEWNVESDGSRTPLETREIITGWGEVKLIDEITTLRKHVFSHTNVTKITLNSNVTTISDLAFKYMDMLSDVDLNGNTNFIIEEGSNILSNKDKTLIYVAWKDVVVPEGFINLKLENCYSVESINLENSSTLTTLGSNCFKGTKIKKVNIPKNINTIYVSSFKYMKNLQEITVDPENTKYKVSGNVLVGIYTGTSTAIALVGYGDVIIPDEVNSLGQGGNFISNYSITSIKLNKTLSNLNNNYNFGKINDDRELKDYFKFIDNEENPNYRIKNNCLVGNPNTDTETVLVALPNENGNIILPNSAKILSTRLADDCNNGIDIKSVTFNEGLREISSIQFSINFKLTKINLPSTIEKISVNNANESPFITLLYLTEFTIGNDSKNENKYFKLENNCLLKKGKTATDEDDPSSDTIIFAYGDVIIPDRITSLTNYAFRRDDSITSITIHNKLTSVLQYSFDAMTTSKFTTINFKGTLKEFKTKVGSTSYSLYDLLRQYSTTTINFLDNDGNIIETHLMSELKDLN